MQSVDFDFSWGPVRLEWGHFISGIQNVNGEESKITSASRYVEHEVERIRAKFRN